MKPSNYKVRHLSEFFKETNMAGKSNCKCVLLSCFGGESHKKIVLPREINYNRHKLGPETSFSSDWKIEKSICSQKLCKKQRQQRLG